MPLSIPGLKNTLEVAKLMGYKVQALNDPVEPVSLAVILMVMRLRRLSPSVQQVLHVHLFKT